MWEERKWVWGVWQADWAGIMWHSIYCNLPPPRPCHAVLLGKATCHHLYHAMQSLGVRHGPCSLTAPLLSCAQFYDSTTAVMCCILWQHHCCVMQFCDCAIQCQTKYWTQDLLLMSRVYYTANAKWLDRVMWLLWIVIVAARMDIFTWQLPRYFIDDTKTSFLDRH